MITLKGDSTLVSISELRTNLDKTLEASKTSKVLIEKRNKPVAVLLPIEKYNEMEEILDLLEDKALGYLARERQKKSKDSDYLGIGEVEKKIGTR